MDCSSIPAPKTPAMPPGRRLASSSRQPCFSAAGRRVVAAVRREPAESTRVSAGRRGRYARLWGVRHLEAGGPSPLVLRAHRAVGAAVRGVGQRGRSGGDRRSALSAHLASELGQLDVDVWILWGPQPVTARGEDRVQAVVIGKHGLQIARGARPRIAAAGRGRGASPRRPGLSATGVPQGRPADRRLERRRHRICGCSRAMRLKAGWKLERPDARPPAVAGGFYPGDAREVQRDGG